MKQVLLFILQMGKPRHVRLNKFSKIILLINGNNCIEETKVQVIGGTLDRNGRYTEEAHNANWGIRKNCVSEVIFELCLVGYLTGERTVYW